LAEQPSKGKEVSEKNKGQVEGSIDHRKEELSPAARDTIHIYKLGTNPERDAARQDECADHDKPKAVQRRWRGRTDRKRPKKSQTGSTEPKTLANVCK